MREYVEWATNGVEGLDRKNDAGEPDVTTRSADAHREKLSVVGFHPIDWIKTAAFWLQDNLANMRAFVYIIIVHMPVDALH